MMKETATFGAGCFWHVQEAFRTIEGVVSTQAGFMGGRTIDPSYRKVCGGDTGHAEVVDVVFDPSRITYSQLLEAFWSMHDPTQQNRQGPDVGTQYRSVIFYHSPSQKVIAEKSRKELEESNALIAPVQTRIEKAQAFYPAEEYHQNYLAKRNMLTCSI
jgi:peptide-methionine (S)-S-oxide reductase